MGKEADQAWPRASEAFERVTDRLMTVPGVISVHGQYTEPVATVVVLVDSTAAREAVRTVEDELFESDPDLPLEMFVYPMAPQDVRETKEALSSGYGLMWSR